MKTIGLCMIVKNEAGVIRRCLESARPLLDYALLLDTGSADGTQQVIRDFLAEQALPGAVIDEPWRDFAHNRSVALARLRAVEHIDYAMILDADDSLALDDGFDAYTFKSQLDRDIYDLEVVHGNIRHFRPHIVSNRLAFAFKGVLHEYLDAPPGPISRATAAGLRIVIGHGGARSANPQKFQDDAALLERTLQAETDPFRISRYTFYLAQSYRDCGKRERARENYLKRAELGYWHEEAYVSLLEAGKLMEAEGSPADAVIAVYERASQLVPARAEALHAASLYCRNHGRNAEGRDFARRGIDLPEPAGLFVQPWVYQWGILDEFAINAYWAGDWRESLDASLRLLAGGKLPAAMVQRVAENARYAAEKLPRAEPPNLGSRGAETLVAQHKLAPQRGLRSRIAGAPKVLVAILAKQKAEPLPLYLDCIEALDYPKSSIVLYIRTNNNTDATEAILRAWVARVGHLYAAVEFDAADVAEPVQQFAEHEWNPLRFRVLGHIRNVSLRRAAEHGCDFYFVSDADNFVRRNTLRELVALDLPIVAPLLRAIAPAVFYSNYHAEIDPNGYFGGCDQYQWILNRWVRGVVEVPVVHCTYLIRADVIPELTYEDDSARHEYVVFSHAARKAGIAQYFDNRQVYGYITFGEGEYHVADGLERARALLADDLQSARAETPAASEAIPAPRPAPSPGASRQKTLLFCTSFAHTEEEWERRYRRWICGIRSSGLSYDDILIVDDASPVLPDWPDAEISTGFDTKSTAKLVIHHFRDHLGRKALFDFPGWHRSFAFAGQYALSRGYEKIVHVESDAFLTGSRVAAYCNARSAGWTALWCPRHGMPETAIQIMAGDAVRRFAEIGRTHPHESLVGREFELQLPFDTVEKRFIGDRYAEYLSFVPGNAEYAAQVKPDQPAEYYWWLPDEAHVPLLRPALSDAAD